MVFYIFAHNKHKQYELFSNNAISSFRF